MKTTVVPAQVTTVEDKIAGNLSFTQLILFTTPVFMSGAIFALLPPFMNLSGYKIVISLLLGFVCVVLAIRVKGKLLLEWFSLIGRYNLRPRYYLYDKNDMHLRPVSVEVEVSADSSKQADVKKRSYIQKLKDEIPLPELVQLETAILDSRSDFHFKADKKGNLNACIKEIK